MRVKIVLSYDGSRFEGYQIQKHTKNTVAGYLQKALQKVGIKAIPIASGRTDRGVHATMQVAHLDLPPFWNSFPKLQKELNKILHPFIHIKSIQQTSCDFHARFSAKKRAYRYLLSQKEFFNPFDSAYITFTSFNPQKIKEALKIFEGEHDFGYFMKRGSDINHSVRTIYKIKTYFYQNLFVIYIEGNGFLRAQVRLMVQAALLYSSKKIALEDIKKQLQLKQRAITTLAPPNGLYLCRVIY